MTVADLFAAAGLTPQGPKVWLESVDEHRPGVYVIALVAGTAETTPATVDVASLPLAELARWMVDQPVIYIGRATRTINRLMLNSLVTREIAEELANDHALRTRVFPRSVNPTLDEQEVHHRTRFIHRLLMDDACRKYADAEGLVAT